MAQENETPADANDESGTDSEINDPAGEVDSLFAAIGNITASDAKDPAEPPTPAKPETPKTPEVKPPESVKSEEAQKEADRGTERLAAREKELRTQKEAWEADKSQYIKFQELNLNPTAVLKKVGIDSDVLMKTLLYEKLPDGNPVKAKLETELSKVLTDKKINQLREEMDRRDSAAKAAEQNSRQYQETIRNVDEYVGKLKTEADKVLPTLSIIGKEDSGVLKELIIEEMVNDAALRYAKGEDGDPVSHEEAAKRIEKRLAKLAPLLKTLAANEDNKGSNSKASAVVVKRGAVRPGPAAAKTKLDLTPQEEADEMIKSILSGR